MIREITLRTALAAMLSLGAAAAFATPFKGPGGQPFEALPPLPIVLARPRGARLTRRAEAFAEHCRGFFEAGAPGLT